MLIVPELKTIVILPPRTASQSIIQAVKGKYRKAVLLYRHMEADGVPFGYDRWEKIGVVRNPVDRLWSVYQYCKKINKSQDPGQSKARAQSVSVSFEQWLLTNEVPFCEPFSIGRTTPYFPEYAIRHRLPENRKSQYVYLRPDLGTKVIPFGRLAELERLLDLRLPRLNALNIKPEIQINNAVQAHLDRFFKWDNEVVCAE